VPVSHAIRAFHAVAAEADRIPEAAVAVMVGGRKVPADIEAVEADPLYDTTPVLFRRTSGLTRLTVFDGGHDIVHEAGLTWLEAQRRGAAAEWEVRPHLPQVLKRSAAASGK
jgi:hypothetical protein